MTLENKLLLLCGLDGVCDDSYNKYYTLIKKFHSLEESEMQEKYNITKQEYLQKKDKLYLMKLRYSGL